MLSTCLKPSGSLINPLIESVSNNPAIFVVSSSIFTLLYVPLVCVNVPLIVNSKSSSLVPIVVGLISTPPSAVGPKLTF